MRRLFLIVAAVLCLASPAQAAITVVQSCGAGGNDVSCTFGAGWTSGNSIFIVAAVNSQVANQLSVTGITTPLTTPNFGQLNIGATNGFYGFCFVVSGADVGDTAFVMTTVGGLNAYTAAVEVSGADACNEDGTEQGNNDATTPYNLTTPLTTTVAGSILLGVYKSTSASDYCNAVTNPCTLATPVPSTGADFPGGDNTGTALGGYRITSASGSNDLQLSSAVNENTDMAVFALKAAVAVAGGPNVGSLATVGAGR